MPPSSTSHPWFTPPQVGERYGVSADKVLAWIRVGELRAVNVAARVGGRPRWRVAESDLLAFEERRSAVPTPPVTKRRRKQDAVIQYF